MIQTEIISGCALYFLFLEIKDFFFVDFNFFLFKFLHTIIYNNDLNDIQIKQCLFNKFEVQWFFFL